MPKIKKILAVTCTSAVVVLLVVFIGSKFGYQSPHFAFFLNWITMTGVAIISGIVKVSPLFPQGYYAIRQWELSGRLYRILGVRLFKELLVRTPFRILNQEIRFSGNRASLTQLKDSMRDAEAAHLLIFGIISLFVGYACLSGWWNSTAWLLLFNVALNLYPIMLQRYNRGRLNKITKRLPI